MNADNINYKLRNANQDDLPAILDIYNYEIEHAAAIYFYDQLPFSWIQNWYDSKLINDFPIVVAENNEKVIGFATYGKFRDRPAYQFTVEHSVYIHKDFRRFGIASALLVKIITMANEAGYHTLIGGVDASNQGSITFHKQHNFTEVAHFKEVGFKFNHFLDLKFFQLILKRGN